ncbi:hypothetical protein EYF80_026035 [Liparis tanakae]|uniref:Uncharacterized protein n=1 Tax=Liparis tanakae TaxID=230148 RepID=A0A4Z2HCX7_9TELE|nr:hypothetical protein EYF80_026035 [Liparis tanakae]
MEMLCFSLRVLTTVAAGDWSTFRESLILPSVGSRPKYLTCEHKSRENEPRITMGHAGKLLHTDPFVVQLRVVQQDGAHVGIKFHHHPDVPEAEQDEASDDKVSLPTCALLDRLHDHLQRQAWDLHVNLEVQ